MTNKFLGLGLVLGLGLMMVVVMVGCGAGAPDLPTTGGVEFFPHTDGYSWTYNIEVDILSSPEAIGTMEVTFNGTTEVSGITVQKRETFLTTYNSLTYTTTHCVKVTDSYVKGYGEIGDTTTEACTTLSFPLSVGKTWTAYTFENVFTAEVIAAENVTVPAGTFATFKIDYPAQGTAYYWYAENIGLVKFALYDDDDNLRQRYELTSKNF